MIPVCISLLGGAFAVKADCVYRLVLRGVRGFGFLEMNCFLPTTEAKADSGHNDTQIYGHAFDPRLSVVPSGIRCGGPILALGLGVSSVASQLNNGQRSASPPPPPGICFATAAIRPQALQSPRGVALHKVLCSKIRQPQGYSRDRVSRPIV